MKHNRKSEPNLPADNGGVEKYFDRVSRAEIIDPVSTGINIAITPAQGVFSKGAPLTSFSNPVIDDLQRDIFFGMFLKDFGLKNDAPEGRETNRMMLEWLLGDPRFESMRFSFTGMLVSAATTAYTVVEQLMESPETKTGMEGLSQAGEMNQQADDLEKQASDDEGEQDQSDDGGDEDEEADGQGQGDSQGDSDEGEEGEGDSGGGGGDGDEQEDDSNGGGDGKSDDDWEDFWNDDGKESKPNPLDDRTPEQKRQEAKDLREKAKQVQQSAHEKIEKAINGQFSTMARSSALRDASEQGMKVQAFLASWGLEEDKPLSLDIDTIRNLMSLMTQPGLANLTQLMGRVYDTAAKVLQGRSQQEIIIDRYGVTKELLDIDSSELALLSFSVPAPIRENQMLKYIRHGLPGVMRVSQAKREGLFISAVDRSGSMQGAVPQQDASKASVRRCEVAMALTLGLARAAKENGQPFTSFGFGHEVHDDLVTDQSPLENLLKFATHYSGGGTDFNKALSFQDDILWSYDEEDRRCADIVFITDGECEVSEEVAQRVRYSKEMYGTRLHLLLVGEGSGYYRNLQQLADNILKFTNIDDIAKTLAEAIWDD